jgi:hypothetical protein
MSLVDTMMLESPLLEEHTPIVKPDTSVSAHTHPHCLTVSNISFLHYLVSNKHRAQPGLASSEYTAGSEFCALWQQGLSCAHAFTCRQMR